MLDCRQITKEFRRRAKRVRVLDGADLQVQPREFVTIRGASGSGKTTLLLTLGAMLSPDAGSVSIAGQDVYGISDTSRARLRNSELGFVFQNYQLIPYLSVLENVLVGAKQQQATEARELLTRLGLADRLEHRPAALSAGEQQRAAIARAMINRPKLILADEPTGNLDPASSGEVFRALAEFRDSGGAVLLVTHGDVPQEIANRELLLQEGKVSPM